MSTELNSSTIGRITSTNRIKLPYPIAQLWNFLKMFTYYVPMKISWGVKRKKISSQYTWAKVLECRCSVDFYFTDTSPFSETDNQFEYTRTVNVLGLKSCHFVRGWWTSCHFRHSTNHIKGRGHHRQEWRKHWDTKGHRHNDQSRKCRLNETGNGSFLSLCKEWCINEWTKYWENSRLKLRKCV